jgi:hypothetical protein
MPLASTVQKLKTSVLQYRTLCRVVRTSIWREHGTLLCTICSHNPVVQTSLDISLMNQRFSTPAGDMPITSRTSKFTFWNLWFKV